MENARPVPRISLLGPQGSGKGTQADLLSLHLGIPVITMSALLKEEVAHGGDRGAFINQTMKAGQLVPTEVAVGILGERVSHADFAKGFILDGFPREVEQQDAFWKIVPFTHVVVLQISDELGIERMTGRLISSCGMIFHELWNPPKQSKVCDKCGDMLMHRDDDTPELMGERLAIYHRETEPVIKRFDELGVLHRVDASPTIPVVHAAVLEALGVPEK